MPDLREYAVLCTLESHRRKVEQATQILRAAAMQGPLVVSSSWGKDSIVLCHLALSALGPVPLLHLARPYELPGYEETRAYFKARTTVHTLESSRTLEDYIDWCKEIGLPHERDKATQGRAVASLKKDRGTEWCLAHGFSVQALGMRAEENPRTRGKLFRIKGPTYEARGLTLTNPLAWWTAKDVWAYIVANAIPYNRRIYNAETHGFTRETLRGGGWLTTDGAERGRITWLRTHFPDEYRRLEVEFPQVGRF